MKHSLTSLSTRKAASTVGVAFITSVLIVTLVDDFLLANFVIPGDTEILAKDIQSNVRLFHFAVVGYLAVLVLDTLIGIALYFVLKPANIRLAWLTSALRLLYALTLVIGIFALVFQVIDVYGYAFIKGIGYIFFALHILLLGYSVLRSVYVPKSLGGLLILASFTYIIFFVDVHLPKTFEVIIMSTMAIAELSLSISAYCKKK
ncbi:DUF4386 domain-containing protein [Maribacter litopenaei]|uniref:DUF4386 domain-containing protein n=1 Tax=Maribacter litopenaei TaxID=2976127 RepID=A0ABY5Y896_9FLAO|nr:DUF4386 domain-containing protein [Maribacter litopenaei]UWX54479.1 DUF4386 domain-containing protein [Maribacter litopenaei]